MSRRDDRFATIRRLREIAEDSARGETAQANGAVRRATDDLEDARREHENRPRAEGPIGREGLLNQRLRGMGSHERVRAADATVDSARARRQAAEEALHGATARRKAIDRLEERRDATRAQAAQRAAERALDDMAIMLRNRRAGTHDDPIPGTGPFEGSDR